MGLFDNEQAEYRLPMSERTVVIVTARNEADIIGETLEALTTAFPKAYLVVADDYSSDETVGLARYQKVRVVRNEGRRGKGGAASAAVAALPEDLATGDDATLLFCDADLGSSAVRLGPLLEPVQRGDADLTVAAFIRKQGGGFGIALGFARWAVRQLSGLTSTAPLSGQRAMSAAVLKAVAPFSPGFGMEVGMTVDAHRAGLRLREIELDLRHRPTRRDLAGFLHRGRQLRDIARAYWVRRGEL